MTQEIKLTQFSKGGGCGCKIAPAVLQEIVEKNYIGTFSNLIVGNESNDDAAVYKLDEERAIISTTDFFMPIVDDPYDFGRVAAANAISDIYAMGGTPLMAIAILGFPIDKLPTSAAQRILEGGRSICNEAGIPIAGGHTIDSSDPIFGLAVTGAVELQHLKRNNGAKEGDKLFLTKSIGVGIMATAIKRGVLNKDHYTPLIHSLTKLNSIGESLGKIDHVHAMTDVTGFGLLGHLVEMSEGSGLSAKISYSAIKKIEHVKEYLELKTIPDATTRNWNSYSSTIKFEPGINVMEAFNLLPDPQTNGGLLIAVAPEGVAEIRSLFMKHNLGDYADPIGELTSRGDKTIIVAP